MVQTSQDIVRLTNACVLAFLHEPAHIGTEVSVLEHSFADRDIDIHVCSQADRYAWPREAVAKAQASHRRN